MPSIDIIVESKIERTSRILQLEGIFDIPPTKKSSESWQVDIPFEDRPWNIGLIIGPSGCGKTTIINRLFKDNIYNNFNWPNKKAVIDGFPISMSIKDISALLNSVGFSSPPNWMRPFHVLSNGEKFRVHIARALAESQDLCVIDEFTSVVDRTVAKIGSAAVAKTIRKYDKRFIAVTCHYDVEEWLQSDWVYKPLSNEFQWRFLQRRPDIDLKIHRVHYNAWQYFKRYHYLTSDLNKAAQCFVAFLNDIPVAFFSYLQFVNNRLKRTKRGHRVVCLPDYQGVGIGMKLEEYIASCLKAIGWDYIGSSAHPARTYYCVNSLNWKMISKPNVNINKNRGKKGFPAGNRGNFKKYLGRMTTTFRYVGPPARMENAKLIIAHD